MYRSLTFIALLCAAAVAFSQQTIGIQLYSLKNELSRDLHGTLADVASWGVRHVEISDNHGLSNAELKAVLDSHHLKAISVPADFGMLDNDPYQIINTAHLLGAKYAVCYWIPHQIGHFSESNLQHAIAVLGKASKILSENGVQLCYHPHWYEFATYKEGTFFDCLADNTDSTLLLFELDVFWIKYASQDPLAVLHKYRYRTPIIHLKDRLPMDGVEIEPLQSAEYNTVLGQGDVGIEEIIRQSANSGSVKYFVLEDESSRSYLQLPQSITMIQRVVR